MAGATKVTKSKTEMHDDARKRDMGSVRRSINNANMAVARACTATAVLCLVDENCAPEKNNSKGTCKRRLSNGNSAKTCTENKIRENTAISLVKREARTTDEEIAAFIDSTDVSLIKINGYRGLRTWGTFHGQAFGSGELYNQPEGHSKKTKGLTMPIWNRTRSQP
jgi:hypothetical protein